MEIIETIIPDEYLKALGGISVQWAHFESVLDLCLVKLSGMDFNDPRSIIIFQHMPFPMKRDILSATCEELKDDYARLKDYKSVLAKIKTAVEGRNKFVHAKWGMDETRTQVEISMVSARGKLRYSIEPVSIDELRSCGKSIYEASEALYDLVIGQQAPAA